MFIGKLTLALCKSEYVFSSVFRHARTHTHLHNFFLCYIRFYSAKHVPTVFYKQHRNRDCLHTNITAVVTFTVMQQDRWKCSTTYSLAREQRALLKGTMAKHPPTCQVQKRDSNLWSESMASLFWSYSMVNVEDQREKWNTYTCIDVPTENLSCNVWIHSGSSSGKKV